MRLLALKGGITEIYGITENILNIEEHSVLNEIMRMRLIGPLFNAFTCYINLVSKSIIG